VPAGAGAAGEAMPARLRALGALRTRGLRGVGAPCERREGGALYGRCQRHDSQLAPPRSPTLVSGHGRPSFLLCIPFVNSLAYGAVEFSRRRHGARGRRELMRRDRAHGARGRALTARHRRGVTTTTCGPEGMLCHRSTLAFYRSEVLEGTQWALGWLESLHGWRNYPSGISIQLHFFLVDR